ncbi:DHH family phosphoesterase, partial [Candidatus Collierbacteria bacterium]|nr:DHH family phosphoesterase [Candidatus Collierbacteria bacterium]
MTTYVIGHQKPDLDATVSAIAVADDPINPETEFVFAKFKALAPKLITAADIKPEDKIVLVDHNEADQRLDNLPQDQIAAIIDHHKFNINLNQVIKITAQPVGSTTTIVYLKFKQYGFNIEPNLAKLMLSAVLSDTVGLKSGTTTEKDRQAVKDLAAIGAVDNVEALTLEIFKAKSNISALTPQQIVKNDYKIFDFAKKTFIGQLETVEQDEVIKNRKAELLSAMNEVKVGEGSDLIFLAISDVLKVNTKL